jgi:predicted nuclease of restriction endonuclease-like (RecB) superfamily
MSMTNLKLFRQFYQIYPEIGQTMSDQFQQLGLPPIGQTPSDQLPRQEDSVSFLSAKELLTHLNFSHFIELIRVNDTLKRHFYEIETLKNAWKVRDLARAIDTLLFERTGLSVNKEAVIAKVRNNQKISTADVIKTPYLLEFLGLEERPEYTEHDMESAIIEHLQHFLTEMRRGFCFEARQKRITFDNIHYRIDLVFYHRILKSHILVDLKLGRYDHADAGQMNLYLNYYRKHEMTEGDHPPVGIILCADKNDALVEYTTTGLSNEVFVSRYLVQLPSKEALETFIRNEMSQ